MSRNCRHISESVQIELRWLRPEEADKLMPWYPNGVGGLVERREPLYYVGRASGP